MNNLIEVRRLSKIYNSSIHKVAALKDINLSLSQGQYLAIAGPSGAGKSTLLHIMGGLDSPSEGEVLYRGKNIFKQNDRKISLFRSIHVGFVFQFYHLIQELNILENVALPSFLIGEKRKTSFKKAQKLLEYLGIGRKLRSFPSELSGGEKQKTAIARALINEPEAIFCDEPTGNLDSASASRVLELLELLNREKKKTVVIVTHNWELAKKADKIIQIKDGQVIDSQYSLLNLLGFERLFS